MSPRPFVALEGDRVRPRTMELHRAGRVLDRQFSRGSGCWIFWSSSMLSLGAGLVARLEHAAHYAVS
jgi:hypothetical protein